MWWKKDVYAEHIVIFILKTELPFTNFTHIWKYVSCFHV